MSDSGAIRAGRAFVELSADDSKLQRSLASVQKKFSAWGSAIAAVGTKLFAAGAAIKAPLIAATNAYAEMGSEMAHASAITGVSVEALSQLKYAAEQSGVSLEGLETGLKKMSRTIVEAAQGSPQATEALARLGVSVSDLASLSPEAKFELLAQKISDIQDPTVKAATAMEIFGKSGTDLLPLLEQGAGGIQALMKHADQLGLTMSGQDAKAALEFSQRLQDLWDVVKMGVFTIGGQLAPAIRATTITLTNIAQAAKKFTQEHPKLIQGVYLFAGGLMTAGAALVGLGLAMKVAGVGIGVVSTALSVVGTTVGTLAAVLGTVLSPIGLILTGIVGAASALIYFSGIGQSVGNQFLDIFKRIWAAMQFVFANTSSASEAWSATMAEAGYFVQEAWLTVKGALVGAWLSFKGFMSGLWDDIGNSIVSAATTASGAFLKIWAQTVHAWSSLVNTAADFITSQMLDVAHDEDARLNEYINKQEAAGRLTHQQAARARGQNDASHYLDDMRAKRDKSSDDELDQKLAAIKAEADARIAYLADLKAKQRAATEQQTAEEKAANQKRIDDAKKAAEAARQAYEAELKKRHDASGEKSILDQVKDLFAPGSGPKLGKFDAQGAADGLSDMMKNTSGGTFNTAAAFGLGGNDVPKHIATIAELTLKQQQDINFMRRQMQQNPGGLAFG